MDYNDIFLNCLNVEESKLGFLEKRFTERQIQYYSPLNKAVMDRILSTSGVCMSFITKSREISFDFAVESFPRPFVCFDIWENDAYTLPARFDDYTRNGTVSYLRRRKEESKITVYLPCTCETYISDINIGAYKPAVKHEKKLLVIGDSIAQGMNGIYPSFNPMTVLANHFSNNLLNQSYGGGYFNADGFDEDLDYEPDLIVFALGTNDMDLFPAGQIYSNADLHIKKVRRRYPAAKTIIITPLWRYELDSDPSYFNIYKDAVSAIEKASLENGCITVYGSALIAHSETFFGPGDVHPNDLGFAQYALNLVKTLYAFGKSKPDYAKTMYP